MKTANISYAKNHLSELIAATKRGDTVIIMDRHKPAARLEPVSGRDVATPDWMPALIHAGVIKPAKRALGQGELRKMNLPVPEKQDIVQALLADREEGR